MNNCISKITKIFLGIVYIFVFIHFLKDITQDILRISSPLDMFGDIKEDISFLPPAYQFIFYYGLGGLSFVVEVFLLIAIPNIIWGKKTIKLKKLTFAGILYLFIFLITCTLLDPRFSILKVFR